MRHACCFVASRCVFLSPRRQESVDLLLGVNRPLVDKDGNILGEFIQEPLDLDLWATRLSQPDLLQQGRQKEGEGERQSAAKATATGKRGGGLGGVGVGVAEGGGAASGFPSSSLSAFSFLSLSLSGDGRLKTTAAPDVALEEAEAGAGSGDHTHCFLRRERGLLPEGRRRTEGISESPADGRWAK